MSPGWWVALAAALILLVFGWYLSSTAGRLDRLHRRIDNARISLDAALLRRGSVVAELAGALLPDPSSAMVLADASHAARTAEDADDVSRGLAESDLTQVLAAVFDDPEAISETSEEPGGRELMADLESACRRVEMSRRFLNDAVRACRAVRQQRLAGLFRLAGHTDWPEFFEMDDSPPAGFGTR